MFLKVFLIAGSVFFVIDMLWLGLIAKNFYRKHLGFLLADRFNWKAAILFYLIFVAGLVFFVLDPALEVRSWQQALLHGALFGGVTYATYDLTNLATVRNWPLRVTLVDLAWGTVLSSSVSIITYFIVLQVGL